MHVKEPIQPIRSVPTDRCFRGVSPSEATEAELFWFFNQAEILIDYPSNFVRSLPGIPAPMSMEEVERRAEAYHAARKIYDRLKRLREKDALLVGGVYTERVWSEAVCKALPGGLAGAAHASSAVRAEYLRALASSVTRADSVANFIEEVVRRGRPFLLLEWRAELEVDCGIAVLAYERVRGDGPCCVPEELFLPDEEDAGKQEEEVSR